MQGILVELAMQAAKLLVRIGEPNPVLSIFILLLLIYKMNRSSQESKNSALKVLTCINLALILCFAVRLFGEGTYTADQIGPAMLAALLHSCYLLTVAAEVAVIYRQTPDVKGNC